MEKPRIGRWVESQLEEKGFKLEEVASLAGDQIDELYTIHHANTKTVYAAWKVNGRLVGADWFLGTLPIVELDGVGEESRLEIIARSCMVKVDTEDVLGRLEDLISRSTSALRD